MKTKKLRVSYSLLHLWAQGKTDDAVSTYFHMDRPTTQAMSFGRRFHEDVAKYIEKEGKLPEWLFTHEIKKPQPELVVTVPYNELFDIKAIFDCLDVPNLFEWKSGVTNSLVWANTHQLSLYFLVAEIAKIKVEKAYLVHWNQYTKKGDFTIVWNNKSHIEYAKNMIDSYAPEIYDFFKNEGLI